MKFYSALADRARQQHNSEYSAQYRAIDDRDLNCIMHTDLCELLARESKSFDRKISVLDLGCGTGRYFHCLRNLYSLTGVDVSPDMLKKARHPVNELKVEVPVELILANIAEVQFSPQSFDLIYCIGVFGELLPLDSFLLTKVSNMLKRGGRFIFTTVDKQSPQATSWKRIAAQTVRPFLPLKLRRKVDTRLRSFRVTEDKLRSLMDKTRFVHYTISRRFSPTGRIDFVCVANMG